MSQVWVLMGKYDESGKREPSESRMRVCTYHSKVEQDQPSSICARLLHDSHRGFQGIDRPLIQRSDLFLFPAQSILRWG